VHSKVDRAIDMMWERYSEPLTTSDLADEVFLSRFYFSRVFNEVTGTSPGRFLSTIRLFKAKNLLLQTAFSVGYISAMVGYNSVGTFTSRFTKSVGLSPMRYRDVAQSTMSSMTVSSASRPEEDYRVVRGMMDGLIIDRPHRIYVGAFDSPIPQGLPTSCAAVDRPGDYILNDLPEGRWFIRAAAVATTDVDPRPWNRRPLLVGDCGPIRVCPEVATEEALIWMRPPTKTDLPILFLLPELDCWQVSAPVVSG
jgi:AraC family transcriptional regulator